MRTRCSDCLLAPLVLSLITTGCAGNILASGGLPLEAGVAESSGPPNESDAGISTDGSRGMSTRDASPTPTEAGASVSDATVRAPEGGALSSDAAPADTGGHDASLPPTAMKPAPMSLISVGRPVVTSAGQGSWLVNDTYFDTGFWDVTTSSKPWAAIDLPRGATRIFVQLYASQPDSIPKAYRLETSADSTNGRDGTWMAGLAITNNTHASRAHVLDFQGKRWLRLVVDEAAGGRVRLNELGVRDASQGASDGWIFIGDSITAITFHPGPTSFSGIVHNAHASYYPLMINAGIGGTSTIDGLAALDANLADFPDIQNWVVSYGTNDSATGDPQYAPAFAQRLRQIIVKLQGAGKSVYVPRIPYKAPNDVTPYNNALDQVVASTGAYPGPDLFAYFSSHKSELNDGVHPSDKGSQAMQRLWAEAVDPLYR